MAASSRQRALLDERSAIPLLERRAQLLLRVHPDGTTPSDGLADGLSRDEQETPGSVPAVTTTAFPSAKSTTWRSSMSRSRSWSKSMSPSAS
jgi:hypothetical protein